jgi:hypothetical protein
MNIAKLAEIRNLYASEVIKFKEGYSSIDFDVIIAGGALRDIFHNKPIKDIDIFLCCRDVQFAQSMGFHTFEKFCSSVGFNRTFDAPESDKYNKHLKPFKELHKISEYFKASSKISFVIENTANNIGYPVQLIGYRGTVEECIDHFDLTINQAWIDESGRMKATSEFRRDSFEKIFRNVGSNRVKPDRLKRLKEKYPNFRCQVKDANQEYHLECKDAKIEHECVK